MKKLLKRRTLILMCLIALLTVGMITPEGFSLPGIQAQTVSAVSYKTTRAAVNMRKSYDSKSDVITVLPANVRVPYYDHQKGWYQVQYNGNLGWVYEEYFYGSTSNDTPTYTTPASTTPSTTGDTVIGLLTVADNLNLRSSMSTASPYNIIGLVPAGTQVGIIKNYSNQWYYILFNGKTKGYIVGGHFTNETSRMGVRNSSTDSYSKAVTKTAKRYLRFRSSRSLTANNIIMTIPAGAQVKVLDRKYRNWYQISYDGITGYVKGGYFTNNNYKEVTAAKLNLRSSKSTKSSSNIILTIPEGKKVTVKKCYNSKWLKVKYRGRTGFVKDGYFE